VAADPDSVVEVTPAADQAVEVTAPEDRALSVNGVPLEQRGGFWHDFGQATGGVRGLATAPLTESIPAEAAKTLYRDREEFFQHLGETTSPLQAAGETIAHATLRKFEDFLAESPDKPMSQRMRESFSTLVTAARERPGLVAGSLVKGFVADPELFFLPGIAGGATAARVAKSTEAALGAGKAAQRVGAVAGGATQAVTGAAISGGAELAREVGEDQPLDTGALGVSAALGALASPLQVPVMRKEGRLSADEIDRMLGPSMRPEAPAPEPEVIPTKDGYLVRVEGQESGGKTFKTKEEAEAAARQVTEQGSAYSALGSVPRGTSEGTAARERLIAEDPFPRIMKEIMAEHVQKASVQQSALGLAKFWGKAAIAAGIGAGIGVALDPDDPSLAATVGAGVTLIPRAFPKDTRFSIERAINHRNGLLNVMARHTLMFKRAIDAKVPEGLRRNAISLFLEGHPGIELNPEELEVANAVRQFFNSMGQTAVDAGVLKEMLKDYVTHIVEEDPGAKQRGTIGQVVDVLFGRERPQQAAGRQFTQHRKWATFEELQQALRGSGLRIKTGDIGEIVTIYSKAMFKAITDRRLLAALKETPADGMPPFVMPPEAVSARANAGALERQPIEGEVAGSRPAPERLTGPPRAGPPGPPGEPTLPPGGFQLPPEPPPGASAQAFARRQRMLLQPRDQADSNYVRMPSGQLDGFVVHKDIAPQLNFVFSARDPHDVTLWLMAVNQASKRALVSFSLFHAKSLLDAFVGAMGTKAFTRGTPTTQAQRMMDLFTRGSGKSADMDLLLQHGLIMQLPEDIATNSLHGALNKISAILDRHLPVTPATQAVKGFAKFNDAIDHFTFQTLQGGFKLITGLDALERLTMKGMPREQAAKLAASYANDIYGSLDWFRVANEVGSRFGRDAAYIFFNPNGRRIAQLLMFAPDWTVSTFRAAYKALPGAVDDPALAALHRRYLAKSALYYLTMASAIQLAIGAPHWVWENENPTRIQLKDGRTMQFSKHFMEPFEWLRDPAQTALNKLAFLPREAIEQATGKEYLSAHDAAPDIENRATHVGASFLPIPAQQGLAGGGALSVTGLAGMPIYGKDEDEKIAARRQKKLAERAKKKRMHEYFQRVNR
jgi:hypothetical protein